MQRNRIDGANMRRFPLGSTNVGNSQKIESAQKLELGVIFDDEQPGMVDFALCPRFAPGRVPPFRP